MSYQMDLALPGRGKTLYAPWETIPALTDPTLRGREYEGKEVWFRDIDWGSDANAGSIRSYGADAGTGNNSYPWGERDVLCRFVRNTGTANILPCQLTANVAGSGGCRVNGLARLTATGPAYPADEFLPPTGVRPNDMFWVVIRGPALVLPDLAGGANNSIAADTVMVSLTAANSTGATSGVTSGNVTAGRVAPQDLTGATSLLGNQIQNVIGRAMSALTTAQTTGTLLVDVGLHNSW